MKNLGTSGVMIEMGARCSGAALLSIRLLLSQCSLSLYLQGRSLQRELLKMWVKAWTLVDSNWHLTSRSSLSTTRDSGVYRSKGSKEGKLGFRVSNQPIAWPSRRDHWTPRITTYQSWNNLYLPNKLRTPSTSLPKNTKQWSNSNCPKLQKRSHIKRS